MSPAEFVLAKLRTVPLPRAFLKNAALLAGSTTATHLIFFVVSPLLTRIYTPEDFGTLGVFASILSIALPIASWRYEIPITLPEQDEVAANVFALAIIILLGMAVLAGTSLWFIGDSLMNILHATSKWFFSCLLIGGLLGGGLFQALNFWALRKKAFAQIARTKLTQGSMAAGTQVMLGLLHAGPGGLLLGDVVGRAAGIRVLAKLIWNEKEKLASSISKEGLFQAARNYKRFPLYSSASGVLNAAGLNIPVILMASFYGAESAGFLALALRLIAFPAVLLGQAVGQVFWAEVSRIRDNPKKLSELFYRVLVTHAIVGTAVAVPLALLAPSAVTFFFGEQWWESGYYVRLLSLAFVGDFAATPLTSTLTAVDRQSLQLVWDSARLVLVTLAFTGAHYWSFSDCTAVLVYGTVQFVAYTAFIILAGVAIRLQTKKAQ